MRSMRALAALTLMAVMGGCSLAQGLRRDAYGDESQDTTISYDYGRRTNDRLKLPPPVTVMDKQVAQFKGEPVDLSGVRAKNGRVTKADFDAMAARNDNSLWRDDGQNNFLFATNKAKMPGDLVTVQVDDDLRSDMVQEFKKRLPEEELEMGVEVAGLGTVSEKKILPTDTNGAVAANAEKKEDGTAAAPAATTAAATPATPDAARAPASEKSKPPLSYIAEVVSRYPNGNVLVRGIKRFTYGDRNYMMEVTSIAKSSDIGEDDVVKSSKFFEYKTELHK